MTDTPRRLGIIGPTATGKSGLALDLARRLGDIEIVTVDSMQVYRGMDVGTAKPSVADRAEIPHHLIDLIDPSETFTLRQFQDAARTAVAEIEARGRRPMLVGGTGLYLRSVVDELEIPGQFPEVRAELERRSDLSAMFTELQQRDPVAAGRIEPGNRRRILRALEVCIGADRRFSSYGEGLERYPPNDWDLIVLDVDRDVLAERIDARFREHLEEGLLAEIQDLAGRNPPMSRTAAQALGYRQLLDHLEGRCTLAEATEQAIAATRRFARRQRSWFRRDPRLIRRNVATDAQRSDLVDELSIRWGNRDSPAALGMGEWAL